MPTATAYLKFIANIVGGETAGEAHTLDFLSDDIYIMMTTSAHTPSDAHEFKSSIDNEVTGTGYVAGGQALANKSITVVADTAASAWQAGTGYVKGDIVRPAAANGHVYICTVAGTSHASVEPTWPTTDRLTVTDGTVTWAEYGKGYVKWDADDPSWANSTIANARRAVIYKKHASGDAVSALMFRINFDQDESSNAAPFTIILPAQGLITFGVR